MSSDSMGGKQSNDASKCPVSQGSQSSDGKVNNSVASGKGPVAGELIPSEQETETDGFSIPEFVEFIKRKGQRGLQQEYEQIVSQGELSGACNACKKRINLSKNRYQDVPCYDSTRVIISTETADTDTATPANDGECSDYIHANFVEGYNQKNAYIATQGPLPCTFADFWKMIWEQNTVVIVMVTRTIEMGRIKSGQYWPLELNSSATHGNFRLYNVDIDDTNPDVRMTHLKLTALKQNEFRTITHLQNLTWPDFGIPSNPSVMLSLLETIRTEQFEGTARLNSKWNGDAMGPPVVIHCSAGLGRTGTLITIDICIKKITAGVKINVRRTVEKLRSQRAYSVQGSDQYLFCYATLIAFIKEKGLLPSNELENISIL